MRTNSFSAVLAVLCLVSVLSGPAWAEPRPGPRHLFRTVLEDKVRGGWAGQTIGVSYGAPTEFRSLGRINEAELIWAPDRVANAIEQDDLYVEMTFARVMDRVGLEATSAQYGDAFRESKYGLWHANAAARRNLNRGLRAPWSGHPRYNIHANDIDFQIESDFLGLMCPGLPREVDRFADRVGRVMNYGDGLYGGMFIGGMYAAAFFEDDPCQVVAAGLAGIPPRSSYAALIRDLLQWSAEYPDDWRRVWQRIEDKWDKDDPCPDGALAPFNIDAKLNGAYVAMGLLFGQRDFGKTIEIATRCGQDSDCNPSSAGGVLGVMLGYTQIPDRFKSGIPALADQKFQFTDYSFNSICASTLRRATDVIRRAGGRVTDTEVIIPFQSPKPPRLKQWSPGVPDRKLGVAEAAWSWQGDWTRAPQSMTARGSGAVATLTFTGVAVVLVGPLSQSGGRADVYLDGRLSKLTLDAYIVKDTHDNALWHTYGLTPRQHTLRLVTRNDADPRSTGKQIVLEQAVIYRAK